MDKTKYEINGIEHMVKLQGEGFVEARKRLNHKDICPVCSKPIIDGNIYLIINNYVAFPNCLAHRECMEPDIKTILIAIEINYKKYKEKIEELRNNYGQWFNSFINNAKNEGWQEYQNNKS